MPQVVGVNPSSPADKKVLPGDVLVKINSTAIQDVLDYQFHSYDENPILTIKTADKKWKMVRIAKAEGEDLGLQFSTYLMDEPKVCHNHCIFCFVDQMPSGMRETLYFKDDDFRLSFLMGNYITLSNLTDEDIERIIRLRISPINVSIHATDPDIRFHMLKNPRARQGFSLMQHLAAHGIQLNAQIVLCPDVNDGEVLERTMADLKTLHPALESVSVVPVGLTRYREGLYPLEPFTSELATKALMQVQSFSAVCLKEFGSRLFFPSDELFLLAKLPLPNEDYYEGYPQLENGVGMLRSFKESLLLALKDVTSLPAAAPFSIASGMLSVHFLQNLLGTIALKCGTLDGQVHAIENHFFGEHITVSGLITGQDIIRQLKGRRLGERLFIPRTMLKHGECVFLDDVSLEHIAETLGVPVIPVEVDGAALLAAIFDKLPEVEE